MADHDDNHIPDIESDHEAEDLLSNTSGLFSIGLSKILYHVAVIAKEMGQHEESYGRRILEDARDQLITEAAVLEQVLEEKRK